MFPFSRSGSLCYPKFAKWHLFVGDQESCQRFEMFDCVLPCILKAMWLKCHSKNHLIVVSKGSLPEGVLQCHQSGSLLLFLSVDVVYRTLEFRGGGKWHTKWERPCAHSSAIPKRGIAQNSHLPVAIRAAISVLLVWKELLCDVNVNVPGTLLTLSWEHCPTARTSFKHMVQVCQCLNPRAFCRECMSIEAPAASKPMDRTI